MARPFTQVAKRTLLAAITGVEPDKQVPRWMDRKYGYTPKAPKGGCTKQQRSK